MPTYDVFYRLIKSKYINSL